ncbi:MAG: Hsp33 family molecular chaperone HslO, partial [Pseudomonadales bacterium]|nr:Hsp33 family molecular chaperone HslO [Pseudomonadales bacterium]
RLFFTLYQHSAGGMLLQQLPAQLVRDQDQRTAQWDHVTILGATLSAGELLTLPAETLIGRLYAEDVVQLLEQREVQFACTCSAERTANALLLLGEAEVRQLFSEMEIVSMTCEFCGTSYDFSADSLAAISRGEAPQH